MTPFAALGEMEKQAFPSMIGKALKFGGNLLTRGGKAMNRAGHTAQNTNLRSMGSAAGKHLNDVAGYAKASPAEATILGAAGLGAGIGIRDLYNNAEPGLPHATPPSVQQPEIRRTRSDF